MIYISRLCITSLKKILNTRSRDNSLCTIVCVLDTTALHNLFKHQLMFTSQYYASKSNVYECVERLTAAFRT